MNNEVKKVDFTGTIVKIGEYPQTKQDIFSNNFFYYVKVIQPAIYKERIILVTKLKHCFDFEFSIDDIINGKFGVLNNDIINPIITGKIE